MSTTLGARKKMTMAVAQENLYANSVVRQIATVDTTTLGAIYNPYTTLPSITSATVSTADYTIGAYASDADVLQVNHRITAAEHVNSYDWKSVGFGLLADRAKNFGSAIASEVDSRVLSQVNTQGGFNLGNGGVLGSTTPWTSSPTVIDDIISACIETVDVNDGQSKKKFMVVSPYEMADMRNFLMNTGGGKVADNALEKGTNYRGTTVTGVDVYQSNNLRNTAVLTFTGVGVNAQTVTINGIVFTSVSTIGTTAGNFLIGADATASATNLVGLINNPTTTNANQVALSAEDAGKIRRNGITAANAAGVVTVTASTTLVVSETQTNASWGAVQRNIVFGAYGSLFLALPGMGMDYTEKEVSGKAGVEVYMEQFMNNTVWTRMRPLVGTALVN